MKILSKSEQREFIESTKLLLETILKVLPDTRGFEGVDPSWDWAWNELSDDAQELIKQTRKHINEAIRVINNDLEGS